MRDTGWVDEIVVRARETRPFCPCGHETIPVVRDDIVWLDCRLVARSDPAVVRHLVVTVLGHAHDRIVDVRLVNPSAAGAAMPKAV